MRPLLLIVLILVAGPASAQGALPDAFYGDWQGEVTHSEGTIGFEAAAGDLNVRIEAADDGFRMRWTGLVHETPDGGLTRQPIEARFTPTDRPGVFAFDPEQSSMLLQLFGAPATNNPLEGEPLLWARLEGEALSVYGLAINADGGFDLYQHVRTLTGDGMRVRHTHRTEQEVMILEGQLRRSGG
jgi:hypothetical protein